MSYRFVFNGKNWFLKISSLDVLNDYMEMVWDIRREDLLGGIKSLKEKKHPASDMIDACSVLASAKGTDVWHEFMDLKERQFRTMSNMIIAGHTLYVNGNGGYCSSLKWPAGIYESDELRWPVLSEEDIRIRKWPGGVHYYAYIGPVQVQDGDRLKWNSESDARAAAMSYVTKKKQTIQ